MLGLCFWGAIANAQNTAIDNIIHDYFGLKDALVAGKSTDAQANEAVS